MAQEAEVTPLAGLGIITLAKRDVGSEDFRDTFFQSTYIFVCHLRGEVFHLRGAYIEFG